MICFVENAIFIIAVDISTHFVTIFGIYISACSHIQIDSYVIGLKFHLKAILFIVINTIIKMLAYVKKGFLFITEI